MEVDMSYDLPVEIWSKILSYLPVDDRLGCCLVSKRLLAAYECLPKSIKHETVIRFNSFSYNEADMAVFDTPSRSFPNVEIDNLPNGSLSFIAKLEEFTSQIVSLTIPRWSLCPIDMYNFVKSAKHLESLTISDLIDPFEDFTLVKKFFNQEETTVMKQSLTNLKHFHFCTFHPFFAEMATIMPPLTSMGWRSAFNQNLTRSVRKSKSTLESLSSNDIFAERLFYHKILKAGLTLKKLSLYSCVPEDGPHIMRFLETQKDLEYLNLGNRTYIFDLPNFAYTKEVLSNFKKVTRLNLFGVSMRHFDSCFGHMKLTHLNISSSDILSSEVISALEKGNFNLKSLIMDKFFILQENLIRMIPLIPNVVELDLTCSSEEVDDRVVVEIWTNLRQLRILRLTKCNRVTDAGFIGSSSNSKGISRLNLHELHISSCRISDLSCETELDFQQLKTIDLTCCSQVTIAGIIKIAQKNPTIQVLKMDDSLFEVEELIKVVEPLTHLRVLQLYHGLSSKEVNARYTPLKKAFSQMRPRKRFLYFSKREL